MILRSVLCFWFFCFVHCDSWGIGTDNNTIQLRTNDTNAENLITTESELDGDKLPTEDNSTKIKSPSENEQDESETVESTERKLSSDVDLTRTNKDSGDTPFEIPEILVKGEPQRLFESNKGDCISELLVKKIVKDVLKYVKKHPEALDLMINENEFESEKEAQSFNIPSDQIYKELRSLQKPVFEYTLFDDKNGCPLTIVRYLEQIPKFLLQLRKYPECLLTVFGCNQEFEIQSTSSGFCEILTNILNVNKIPRPDSIPTHEFIFPTPEVSFENMEPNGQIQFHLEENESHSDSEIKQYLIIPKHLPQEEMPIDIIEPFKNLPAHVPVNIQPFNDTYIKPIHTDTESSNESKANYFKHHKLLPLSLFTEPESNTNQAPVTTYNSREVVEDTYLDDVKEKLKPIYVAHPELNFAEELKPGHKPTVIHESTPIYIEKFNPISVDNQKDLPMHVQKPTHIAIQEPEPIYGDDTTPVNNPIYVEEQKPIYYKFPVYIDESTPNYEAEYSPTYVDNIYPDEVKKQPKFIYTEELKPGNKPIAVNKPASVYVEKVNSISDNEHKYQKPIHVMEPTPIGVEKPESISIENNGPINEPINFEKPDHIYNEQPIHFDEDTPIYGTQYSPTYVKDIYKDEIKENSKLIFVAHPELINDEELKPSDESTLVHKHAAVYVENLNHITIDNHKSPPIHVKEPKPIAIQTTEPIYVDDERPINKPIHIEELKPAYHQYPVYIDESTPIHSADNSPTFVENIFPDFIQEKPKPYYAGNLELPYTEQLKPDNKPVVIDKPAPVYVDKFNPISVDESKEQKLLPILIKETKSIPLHDLGPIHSQENRPDKKPIYVEEYRPIYNQHPVYFDEATPFFGTEYSPTYVEDMYSKEVKEKPRPMYVEHPELINVKELKPGTELIYLNEPKPIYVEDDETNNVNKVVSFEKPDLIENSEPTYVNNMQNPMLEIQPGYIDYSIPTHEKEYINEGLRPIDVEEPESIYIDKLKPIFVEKPERPSINNNPDYFYIKKPEYIYTDEIKPEPTHVEKENDYIEYPEAGTYNAQIIPELINKPQPIYVEETSPDFKLKPKPVVGQPESVPDYIDQFNTYFEKPQHIDYPDQETIYPGAPEILYPDQQSHLEDSQPIYVQPPEMTFINKPNSIDEIQPIHMPQTSKEQTVQQVYTQILPSNVVEQITELINNNPEKHIKNIKEVLQGNQHVIKPPLYRILFSVLNALIKGIVDSKRFSEIVNYLIQPHIDSEWNNKKIQALYYLLSPGKTGQVEASTLDVIYGLIHQPKNTSNNPQMLDLMFPLLKNIKTEHVDHRINDIILALLYRNKNNIFSDKEVEILLTFIKPNKMGYIPKQLVNIAATLVNFDKIPYFFQNNIKTIFLLMSRNKTGRIDPRAIQILTEILHPKKFSFLTEQNIIDLLEFLRTDYGESVDPKRLDITLFLLKSKPQAPILIDCFINSLKEHDIIHSKFIDIILYLNKNRMLTYNVLETLVSLLSQEKSGRVDSKTYNSFLLLLEPYKSSRPKVVLHVYHILNRETFSTPNLDMSTLPHNMQVLMYYLLNSGTNHFDQSLIKGYTQPELKKLLSNILKSEPVQNNELVPQLLEHNNGYVELTYLLNEEEPILYNPVYYVKYNIPLKDFLIKIQDIIARNPELSNDPPKLLQELTRAGSVSGVSPNLNGFQKEEILKLTFEDGKMVQAKVLDEKKLHLNDQIKRIQDFNSNTSPQEILQQNEINAAKYYTTYRDMPGMAGTSSVVHGGNIGSLDGLGPIVMSFKKNNLREFNTIGEPNRTYNSTQTLLIGSEDVNTKNETELQQNKEN